MIQESLETKQKKDQEWAMRIRILKTVPIRQIRDLNTDYLSV